MNRRQFLSNAGKLGLLTMGSTLLPLCISPATAAPKHNDPLGFDLLKGSRYVYMHRPATNETISLEYLKDGVWQGDAYNQICWFLRDARAKKHVQMDTNLIAILDWTHWYLRQYGYTQPLVILSGYRSPETNAATEGAKQNSQHLYGRAVDLTIPGLDPAYLGQLFKWLARGGVGIYEGKNFVHLDTAHVRSWRG